jgi:hypothetical protein
MKYWNVKRLRITHLELSRAFGYKSVSTFRNSSAHKRFMEGIDVVLGIALERIRERI